MRKLNGFSMMDLIITMIVVCLIMGASLPFMTQKAKKINVEKYGEYICFAAPVRDVSDNVTLNAISGEPTWQLYQISRYNSDVMPEPTAVDECVFEVPQGVTSFNIRLIGGGGGGGATATSSVSLNKFYNNYDDTNVFNLNTSAVTFENPFEKYGVSDNVFFNKVLTNLYFFASGGNSATCKGGILRQQGASVGETLKREAGTGSMTGAGTSGSMIYQGSTRTIAGGEMGATCKNGAVSSNAGANGEIHTNYQPGGTFISRVNNYSWSHREDAFKVAIAKGGGAGAQFLKDGVAIPANIAIQKCDASNATSLPEYCVGTGGRGGIINGDTTSINGVKGYKTRFNGAEADGGAAGLTIQSNVQPKKDTANNFYIIEGQKGASVPYAPSSLTKTRCTFNSGTYNCNGLIAGNASYGAGGSGALVNIATPYLLKNHNVITFDSGDSIDIQSPEDTNTFDTTTTTAITTGYGGAGMGGAIIITW